MIFQSYPQKSCHLTAPCPDPQASSHLIPLFPTLQHLPRKQCGGVGDGEAAPMDKDNDVGEVEDAETENETDDEELD